MRQIKFRGKDLNTGDWVYGDLHTLCDKPHIHTEPTSYPFAGKRSFVNSDTIGQYTGLQDKNGREIYEGDIIRKTETTYRMTDIGVVKYCNEEAKFVLHVTDKYRAYDFSFVKDFQSQDGHATVPCHNEYEVVGNVYDDKELLKQ
jgi:uncharacterized phage protein (TIGR01671 family)